MGGDEIDAVGDFALAYPLRAVMTLVGIPPQEYPRMLRLTQEFFGTADPETRRADVEELSPEAAAQQWAATIQEFFAILT
jgi:cytochrome P450